MNFDQITLDHISPSSIATYLDSPLRWYEHYVEGKRDEYSLALHRGLVVHDVLERAFAGDIEEFDFSQAADSADILRQLERSVDDFDLPETVSLIEDYWEKHGQHLRALEIEMPFSIDIPYARKLRSLIGRIDLIHDLGGRPAIIDWKTGRRKRSPNDVKNDPQAIIYGIAIRDKFEMDGIIPFQYHQLVFKTVPEIAILDRPVTPAEMREFEEDFLPGFITTLELQLEHDAWFFNPNAKFGKRHAA